MAIVKQRSLSWWEKLYLGPIVRGLLLTFRKIFVRKITRQYPEERLEPTAALHGHPVLVKNDDGSPQCVACGLCEFVCPPRAITIQPGETDRPIEREPKSFEIDMLRCIYCGYCEEVCPEEAIVMSQEYEVTGASRQELGFGIDKLLSPRAQLMTRIEYIRKVYDRWKD